MARQPRRLELDPLPNTLTSSLHDLACAWPRVDTLINDERIIEGISAFAKCRCNALARCRYECAYECRRRRRDAYFYTCTLQSALTYYIFAYRGVLRTRGRGRGASNRPRRRM